MALLGRLRSAFGLGSNEPACRAPRAFNQHSPLIRLNEIDYISAENFCGSALVCGSTGACKSTALIPAFTSAWMMRVANSSVVLTSVKASDPANAQRLAEYCGRSVTVFKLGVDRYNPLAHALKVGRGQPAHQEVLVDLALTPHRQRQRAAGGGGGDSAFFDGEVERGMSQLLTAFRIAGDVPLSFRALSDAWHFLPKRPSEVHQAEWKERCPVFKALQRAQSATSAPQDRADLEEAARYMCHEFPRMPPKTQACIIASATSPIHPLIQGVTGATLNTAVPTWNPTDVTTTPQVLVIDCPTETGGSSSVLVQRLILSGIMNEVTKRPSLGDYPAVLLCIDEYPALMDPRIDAAFMARARDRKSGLCLAFQSISQLKAGAGADPASQTAAGMLAGLCATKVFGMNGDPDTIEYVERAAGRSPRVRVSITTQTGRDQKGSSTRATDQATVSREEKPEISGRDLMGLRSGPQHGWTAEAFVLVAGKRWSNGKSSLKCVFPQLPCLLHS
jgi:hypothetical protein